MLLIVPIAIQLYWRLAYAVCHIIKPFPRPLIYQEKQRAARARKQRMLEMEVEAKRKALKSDIEVRNGITQKMPTQMTPAFVK